MATEISNHDDVIDSRDVIARIEELTEERDAAAEADARTLVLWEEQNADELRALLAFESEAKPYCEDWKHGETLVRDSYFVEYAQQLAEDCCDMPRDLHWPFTCIDWQAAADELRQDYTSAEFDGVTYWFR